MMRVTYIIREVFRNFGRHPGLTLGSFLSLTLLFLLFDLFWIAGGTAEGFYRRLISEMQMEVFVAEELPDSSRIFLDKAAQRLPAVAKSEFISKAEARERLEAIVGLDLLAGYEDANPLPASYVLSFNADYLTLATMEKTRDTLIALGGVDEIIYSGQWLSKAERLRGIILRVGTALGLLIVATALISSSTNIRMLIANRAAGLAQMRLLGASRLFLAMPYLLEAFLITSLAATIGWVSIWYASQKVTFTRFELVIPPVDHMVVFCGVAALVGLISGYLGIRRMLK